ncbi:efflux RND transporter periplasmic adaptor subunit [Aquimarina sp. U1-2]|uniref:efflux RND transporter periplasmic adaptor subunit n=1 Tax=Aquimarina sp. U1-2 TaxID=2823141 RepID=UPI001AECC66C|nr:efflux RND transporter periplasmic adaptor subunit [Aquimarina sp. U1-2]MBP2832492.1 efflux RND transporter periplasmic adaptor subunit [Aquimarina sp. U1-2]
MNRKKLLFLLIISIVLIVVLIYGKKSGWFGNSGNFEEVTTTIIEKIRIVETVAATGKIQPEVEVKLSSEVSGEIIDLPIKEGQQVQKGDLLVRINPDIIQSGLNRSQAALQNVKAGLQQAEASLTEAQLNYDRNKGLFERGVISKADWDASVSAYEVAKAARQSAFYNVKSAQATVNEAKDNLNRTTIYAPMSGTISKLSVELGERVVGTQQMAGTEIVRVANLNNMEVEVDVNENDIVKVSIGDSTLVAVDAYLKKEFKGLVTEIANSAESATSADQVTNFKVKVRILEDSYKDIIEGKPENYSPFRPGMTATVDVITDKRESVIGVPISAIVIKSDTSNVTENGNKQKLANADKRFECVFLKKGEVAKLQVIETGIQDDSNIEIIKGLEIDDEVIVGPYNVVTKILKTGDKVTTEAKKTD